MKKLTILLAALIIISQPVFANDELDMSDIGNKLAICSAKSSILSAVLQSERRYAEKLYDNSLKWRESSINSFMTEEGIKLQNARKAYDKVAEDTVINSGIKESIADKDELVRITTGIIYYIDEHCQPYSEMIFNFPSCHQNPKDCQNSFYKDVNFDGVDELIKRLSNAGQRHSDAFEVYQKNSDGEYVLLTDVPFFKDSRSQFNLMDSSTVFDSMNKTIKITYSSGACSSEYETYKIDNAKAKLIKLIAYDYMDENGNDIGCTEYTYVDGILISEEKMSK